MQVRAPWNAGLFSTPFFQRLNFTSIIITIVQFVLIDANLSGHGHSCLSVAECTKMYIGHPYRIYQSTTYMSPSHCAVTTWLLCRHRRVLNTICCFVLIKHAECRSVFLDALANDEAKTRKRGTFYFYICADTS